jgi:hypothetical protein
MAPQPATVVPASLKLTDPLGAAPATVAVNVTIEPTAAGFAELTTVVLVAPGDFGAELPQLPLTPPAPFNRNVAVATHPGVTVIATGAAPPSATGVIGCGEWNETSLDELEYGPTPDPPVNAESIDSARSEYVPDGSNKRK